MNFHLLVTLRRVPTHRPISFRNLIGVVSLDFDAIMAAGGPPPSWPASDAINQLLGLGLIERFKYAPSVKDSMVWSFVRTPQAAKLLAENAEVAEALLDLPMSARRIFDDLAELT